MANLSAILALGFFLGVRHATDPDHVVAVTAIVSRERTARAALWVGVLWGLGHTVTILLVGGAIVLFGLVIPPRLGLSMEMSVAVMLVVLGVMNVTGAVRAIRERADGVRATLTSAAGAPAASRPREGGRFFRPLEGARFFRPLVIGVVHGMAGSAAIALLVLATIRTPVWAVVYLGVFGLGTILGMGILTLAIAMPILRVSAGSEVYERTLIRVTGIVSIALGLFLVYRIGVVDGLFVGKTLMWTPE